VCFTDATNGWAVGSNGSILRSLDGGESWTTQPSGTTNYLSSVYFHDTSTGWVVGNEGLILKTVDGGTHWIAQGSGITVWLRSVWFQDSQTGWAVGANGVFLMTTDGGESWSPRKSFTNKTLSSIYFKDANTGWVVGESGTILNLMMNNLATAIEDRGQTALIPQEFLLYQNYPNPFNPRTTIKYSLPKPSYVSLKIYSLLGESIKEIVNERQSAGIKSVMWDGTDHAGRKVSSGIYLYKLETDQESEVRKMILIR
jgi:hypothetical protein